MSLLLWLPKRSDLATTSSLHGLGKQLRHKHIFLETSQLFPLCAHTNYKCMHVYEMQRYRARKIWSFLCSTAPLSWNSKHSLCTTAPHHLGRLFSRALVSYSMKHMCLHKHVRTHMH